LLEYIIYTPFLLSSSLLLPSPSYRVVAGLRPLVPPDMPQELAHLMQWCWDGHPSNRPSFTKIANTMREMRREYRRRHFVGYVATASCEENEEQKNDHQGGGVLGGDLLSTI